MYIVGLPVLCCFLVLALVVLPYGHLEHTSLIDWHCRLYVGRFYHYQLLHSFLDFHDTYLGVHPAWRDNFLRVSWKLLAFVPPSTSK